MSSDIPLLISLPRFVWLLADSDVRPWQTKFLNEAGIEQYVQHGGAPKDCALQINKGTFKWAEASADPVGSPLLCT